MATKGFKKRFDGNEERVSPSKRERERECKKYVNFHLVLVQMTGKAYGEWNPNSKDFTALCSTQNGRV